MEKNPEIVNVLAKLGQGFIKLFRKKEPSGTGLKKDDLKNFWDTLEGLVSQPNLGVAMTEESSITLQDYACKLKKNLKMLRMEAHQFSIGSTSNQPPSGLGNLGVFGSLTDLNLTSNTTIKDINNIHRLPNVLCLRLYGVCRDAICKIEIRGFPKLMKLVIGDMEQVTTVEIGCDVIGKIATLKLYKLPRLTKVVFAKNPLLTWDRRGKVDNTSKISETVFLRKFGRFPADIKPGLMIYHSSIEKQWTKYIMCE